MPNKRFPAGLVVLITGMASALVSGCANEMPQPANNSATKEPTSQPSTLATHTTNSHERVHLPVTISFVDLDLKMKPGQVFGEEMLSGRAKELINKRVRIEGVMYLPHGKDEPTEFILMDSAPRGFGSGRADTLILARTHMGLTEKYPDDQRMIVEGVLRLEPFQGVDGSTWSIYGLEDARVIPRR